MSMHLHRSLVMYADNGAGNRVHLVMWHYAGALHLGKWFCSVNGREPFLGDAYLIISRITSCLVLTDGEVNSLRREMEALEQQEVIPTCPT